MAREYYYPAFIVPFFRMSLTLSVCSLWKGSAFLTNVPNAEVQHPPTSIGYSSALSHRTFLPPLAMAPYNATQESFRTIGLFTLEDPGLLTCDLGAILIASQLMGLLDVVNDPEFSRSGGWLQPIPAAPSTLKALVDKITMLSILWFPLSTIRLPSFSSSSLDESGEVGGIGKVVKTVALFSVFRLGVAVAFSNFSAVNFDLFDVLRDCYLVGLATVTFRFLYRQYFL